MTIDDFLARAGNNTQQTTFVHFTDSRNLPLIRQYGLLSLRELREREIEIPAPGGNELSHDLDEANGMDAYVHLSFLTGNPMAFHAMQDGRIENLIYLWIKLDVMRLPGVLITKAVANKNGVVPGCVPDMLDELDLDVMYTRTDWKNPAIQARLQAARKCELLIPDQVPTKYIKNL